MMERLPTKVWVDALVRRAQVAGAAAFVLQSGDEERGDVLVKVARLDGTAAVYTPTMNLDGDRIFLDLIVQGIGPDEAGVDAYVRKARDRDRDLWVIEIEDRDGRHFLTEPVESPEPD
ncbi:MAG: DUF1491 family protein [Pseudomonadota bacterium]|jgi:hypothetical protein|nr:DUF1491 family protein [Pseudomonadota bacterium]